MEEGATGRPPEAQEHNDSDSSCSLDALGGLEDNWEGGEPEDYKALYEMALAERDQAREEKEELKIGQKKELRILKNKWKRERARLQEQSSAVAGLAGSSEPSRPWPVVAIAAAAATASAGFIFDLVR